LRATRRRQRKTDPLASVAAVRSVIKRLRAALPDLIPSKDKELVRLLRAARHAQRYSATDTKRGRPGKWKRENLFRVAAHLGDIIDRETSSHISFSSFVDHYLRLPDFPSDVIEALESGEINLFEAEQLGFAFREIKREDVSDDEIEELLRASEPILAILSKIQRHKEQTKIVRV
jgi:hypothetical protein